jgi:hypothetical protein
VGIFIPISSSSLSSSSNSDITTYIQESSLNSETFIDENKEQELQKQQFIKEEHRMEKNWKLRLQKLQKSNLLSQETIRILDRVFEVSNLTYAKKQSELSIAKVFRDKLKKITPDIITEMYVDVEKYNNVFLNFAEIITTLGIELKNAHDNGLITIYYQRKIQEEINEKFHSLKTNIIPKVIAYSQLNPTLLDIESRHVVSLQKQADSVNLTTSIVNTIARSVVDNASQVIKETVKEVCSFGLECANQVVCY